MWRQRPLEQALQHLEPAGSVGAIGPGVGDDSAEDGIDLDGRRGKIPALSLRSRVMPSPGPHCVQ